MPARRPKPTKNRSHAPAGAEGGERLQKVMAAAGVGSRRKCEELIVQGRVEVDRQVVNQLGAKVDPLTQEIRVDGQVLRKNRTQYFVVNKPEGVLSTNYDQQQRMRVFDLVDSKERLFCVGRLDQYSEGLMLLTNDGELANRLMHPRYGAEKTYIVLVAGEVTPETLARLKKGVYLSEGVARVTSLRVRKTHRHSTEMEMVLQEGKNRELRRILAAVDHKVMKLRRVQLGPLKLGELPVGAHRQLSADELDKLRQYAYSSRAKKKSAKTGGKGPLAAAGAKLSRERKPPEPVEDDEAEYSGPVLVDDELTQFDDRSFASSSPGERRAGAIIGDEDDEAPAKSAAPRPSGKRPAKRFGRPTKFAKGVRGGAARPSSRKKAPQKFPRKKR